MSYRGLRETGLEDFCREFQVEDKTEDELWNGKQLIAKLIQVITAGLSSGHMGPSGTNNRTQERARLRLKLNLIDQALNGIQNIVTPEQEISNNCDVIESNAVERNILLQGTIGSYDCTKKLKESNLEELRRLNMSDEVLMKRNVVLQGILVSREIMAWADALNNNTIKITNLYVYFLTKRVITIG